MLYHSNTGGIISYSRAFSFQNPIAPNRRITALLASPSSLIGNRYKHKTGSIHFHTISSSFHQQNPISINPYFYFTTKTAIAPTKPSTTQIFSTCTNAQDASTTMQTHNNIISEEIILQCTDGMQLAGKKWSSNNHNNNNIGPTQKIICLHGWLDNAASFDTMAPVLVSNLQQQKQQNVELLALDFPGHGLSSHKSSDGPPQLLSEYAYYVTEALNDLNWIDEDHAMNDEEQRKVTVIGHSMGSAVALIFAAAYPECVDRLVILDSGTVARKSVDVSRHIRRAIHKRMTSNKTLYPKFSNSKHNTGKNNKKKDNTTVVAAENLGGPMNNLFVGKRKYPNIDAAINARMKTATLSPGNQYISKETAEAMVRRAITVVKKQEASGEEHNNNESPGILQGPVYFRHDPRLMWPSMHYFTEEQFHSLLDDINCPTCVLKANDGWPIPSENEEKFIRILQPIIFQPLPGSHHFHSDPEHSFAVSNAITEFLTSS